jgi:hypothetical protein
MAVLSRGVLVCILRVSPLDESDFDLEEGASGHRDARRVGVGVSVGNLQYQAGRWWWWACWCRQCRQPQPPEGRIDKGSLSLPVNQGDVTEGGGDDDTRQKARAP